MKRNEIPDIVEKIYFQNYENLFNVHELESGEYYYNVLKKVNIPNDVDPTLFEVYIVEPGDTWTLLSHVYYGDVKLWWAICIANNIRNPLLLPEPGVKLRVLTPYAVQGILTAIQEG